MFQNKGRWLLLLVLCFSSTLSFAYAISDGGEQLNSYLDSLDVSNKWLGGEYIDWLSGEAREVKTQGEPLKSHCSAFVASAANHLGIYILRPPQHEERLLANAQNNWLKAKGPQFGWFPIPDGFGAQQIANNGCLVVASFQNPKTQKPGHIAIVRPDDKTNDELQDEGPEVIQAGVENYDSTSLVDGFSHHIQKAQDRRVNYFGHDTNWCKHNEMQYVAKESEKT